MDKGYSEPKMVGEYSDKNGCDILNPSEERGESHGDKGFYSHMMVNKLKTGHKKAKAKYQRGDF